jgi:hypothetical protein
VRNSPRSRTLAHLRAHLEQRGARVQICTLLNKLERRVVDVDCKYVGFQVCMASAYSRQRSRRLRSLSAWTTPMPDIWRDGFGCA